jgi:hypothetical protein
MAMDDLIFDADGTGKCRWCETTIIIPVTPTDVRRFTGHSEEFCRKTLHHNYQAALEQLKSQTLELARKMEHCRGLSLKNNIQRMMIEDLQRERDALRQRIDGPPA